MILGALGAMNIAAACGVPGGREAIVANLLVGMVSDIEAIAYETSIQGMRSRFDESARPAHALDCGQAARPMLRRDSEASDAARGPIRTAPHQLIGVAPAGLDRDHGMRARSGADPNKVVQIADLVAATTATQGVT